MRKSFVLIPIACCWLACFVAYTSTAASPEAASPNTDKLSLESLDLLDYRGQQWSLDDFRDDSVLIVAFLGTECPLAKHYSIRLKEIAAEYEARSVRVIAVMSNRQDSMAEIAAFAKRQELEFPVLKDAGNRFADQLGAERTPEMFVFDANRTLRYRGRVDDQQGIDYVRDEPRRHDLRIALNELLSGRQVSLPRTSAAGCIIGRTKKVDDHSNVTYGSQVADILNRRCVECHRDGEIAPFSLTDYDEVAGWSDMIAEVVRDGRMPPWHATGDHEKFSNDRSLSEEEKAALYAWADAGAPQGESTNLPLLAKKTEGWQLPRKPDLIIPVSPEPFEVPATGAVEYQYFEYTFDPGLKEDVWIEAAELKPGNREVVHHILAFAVPKGQRRGLGGARGFLVGYVPGARVELAPKGHAKRIPAGSELIFQVHYTPVGTVQKDQSMLGIVFADPKTITHEIVTTSAVEFHLRIPPGDPNHEVDAAGPRFPAESTLLSFSPHMHLRGKSYRYDLETPDGVVKTLLDIPAYDFNWQTTYSLATPIQVPQGSRIQCTAVFDNSKGNLNLTDDDTAKTVTWGEQTWDEMMIGYYHYSVPLGGAPNALTARQKAKAAIQRASRLKRFDQLDTDNDGKLSKADMPRSLLDTFKQLDRNHDDVLTREETAAGN